MMNINVNIVSDVILIAAALCYINALFSFVCYGLNKSSIISNKEFWMATFLPGYIIKFLGSN